jgi:hypothetical protein
VRVEVAVVSGTVEARPVLQELWRAAYAVRLLSYYLLIL